MHGTVVGVLRGGPSREHDVSLRSGHTIISNLPDDRYTVRDIYIDKEGVWHERGLPTQPERVLRSIDVAMLGALHGEYGENGDVQRLLERFGTPYTGADAFGTYLAMHKVLTKEKAKEHGVLTPLYRFVEKSEDAERVVHDVIRSFAQPVIVKPNGSGSSVGVSIVGGYQLVLDAVKKLFSEGVPSVLIEERIRGTEATAGVVEGLRGEVLYALPPVEIIPPEYAGFFAAHVKYNGETQEIVPGRFSKQVTDELMQAARTMHEALGQRHYSRSDFIVSPKGVYFLETNSAVAVGLTNESLMPKSLAAVGVSLPDFFSHVIGLALDGKRR